MPRIPAVAPGLAAVARGRRRLAPVALATTAVLLVMSGKPAAAQYPSANTLPTGSPDDVARMAEAVNAIRLQNGRTPLKTQPQLMLSAQRHADYMVQTRTLSHTGAGGSRPADRMRAAGYETCGGGENVAFGALQTVDDVARGWYDSPGHRQIMLDADIREMGIGRGQTSDGMTYWALDVGQRPSVAPVVVNNEAMASTTGSVSVYVYGQLNDYCRGPARQVVQVTLANNADFSDGQVFSYSPTLTWTLGAGEGVRTLYARLLDSTGRTNDAQDTILVSSTAPPPNTASNVSPPVQTYQVAGANGVPTTLTVYRASQIVPSNASVTSLPCGGSLTGCWNTSTTTPASTYSAPQTGYASGYGYSYPGASPSPYAYAGYGGGYAPYSGYGTYGGYPGYAGYGGGYAPYGGYGTYGGYAPYSAYGGYGGYGGYAPGGGWSYPAWPGYGSY